MMYVRYPLTRAAAEAAADGGGGGELLRPGVLARGDVDAGIGAEHVDGGHEAQT